MELTSFIALLLFLSPQFPEKLVLGLMSVVVVYISSTSSLLSINFMAPDVLSSNSSKLGSIDERKVLSNQLSQRLYVGFFQDYQEYITKLLAEDSISVNQEFMLKAINFYTKCAGFLISNSVFDLLEFFRKLTSVPNTKWKQKYETLIMASMVKNISREDYTKEEEIFLKYWMVILISYRMPFDSYYHKSILGKAPKFLPLASIEHLKVLGQYFHESKYSILKVVIQNIATLWNNNDPLGKTLLDSLKQGILNNKEVLALSENKGYYDFVQVVVKWIIEYCNTDYDSLFLKDDIFPIFTQDKMSLILRLKANLNSEKKIIYSFHHIRLETYLTKDQDNYFEVFLKSLCSQYSLGGYYENKGDGANTEPSRKFFIESIVLPYFIAASTEESWQIFTLPLSTLLLKLMEYQYEAQYFNPNIANSIIGTLAAFLFAGDKSKNCLASSGSLQSIAWRSLGTLVKGALYQIQFMKEMKRNISLNDENILKMVIEIVIYCFGKYQALLPLPNIQSHTIADLSKFIRRNSKTMSTFYKLVSSTSPFRYDVITDRWSHKSLQIKDATKLVVEEEKNIAFTNMIEFLQQIFLFNDLRLNTYIVPYLAVVRQISAAKITDLDFLLSLDEENSQPDNSDFYFYDPFF